MAADDPVTYWMNQAGRYPLLAEDQLLRLAKIVKTQGEDSLAGKRAVQKIVRHNLRLIPVVVRSMMRKSRRFSSTPESLCDYYQAGTFGLHRAACLYDCTRGYKFSTYAFMWIRQSVQRFQYLMHTAIYVPENYYTEFNKFNTFEKQEELRNKNPRSYERHVAAHRVISGMNSLTFTCADGEELESSSNLAFLSNALTCEDTIEDMLGLSSQPDYVKDLVIETQVNGISIAKASEKLGVDKKRAALKIKECLKEMREALSC